MNQFERWKTCFNIYEKGGKESQRKQNILKALVLFSLITSSKKNHTPDVIVMLTFIAIKHPRM